MSYNSINENSEMPIQPLMKYKLTFRDKIILGTWIAVMGAAQISGIYLLTKYMPSDDSLKPFEISAPSEIEEKMNADNTTECGLAFMVAGAAIGFALMTYESKREPDKKGPPEIW